MNLNMENCWVENEPDKLGDASTEGRLKETGEEERQGLGELCSILRKKLMIICRAGGHRSWAR